MAILCLKLVLSTFTCTVRHYRKYSLENILCYAFMQIFVLSQRPVLYNHIVKQLRNDEL